MYDLTVRGLWAWHCKREQNYLVTHTLKLLLESQIDSFNTQAKNQYPTVVKVNRVYKYNLKFLSLKGKRVSAAFCYYAE